MHTSCVEFTKYVECGGGTCGACSPNDAARRLGVWPSGHQFPEFRVKSFHSDSDERNANATQTQSHATQTRLVLQLKRS